MRGKKHLAFGEGVALAGLRFDGLMCALAGQQIGVSFSSCGELAELCVAGSEPHVNVAAEIIVVRMQRQCLGEARMCLAEVCIGEVSDPFGVNYVAARDRFLGWAGHG